MKNLTLTLILMLGLVGCNQTTTTSSPKESEETTTEEGEQTTPVSYDYYYSDEGGGNYNRNPGTENDNTTDQDNPDNSGNDSGETENDAGNDTGNDSGNSGDTGNTSDDNDNSSEEDQDSDPAPVEFSTPVVLESASYTTNTLFSFVFRFEESEEVGTYQFSQAPIEVSCDLTFIDNNFRQKTRTIQIVSEDLEIYYDTRTVGSKFSRRFSTVSGYFIDASGREEVTFRKYLYELDIYRVIGYVCEYKAYMPQSDEYRSYTITNWIR